MDIKKLFKNSDDLKRSQLRLRDTRGSLNLMKVE